MTSLYWPAEQLDPALKPRSRCAPSRLEDRIKEDRKTLAIFRLQPLRRTDTPFTINA